MRRNPRTAATSAVAEARLFSVRLRAATAVVGCGLLAIDPNVHPHPALALIGFAVIILASLFAATIPTDGWLSVEEAFSCIAGVLIVTLGGGEVSAVTLLWLACVVIGVLARGGRAGAAGRVLIVLILFSPLALHGVDAATVGLPAAALPLLLAAGRISVETSELLRDPLTGVLARAALDDHLEQWTTHAQDDRPVWLIMVDLDEFGVVNKRRGHRAGDELLVKAAAAMAAEASGDDLLGRVGGDEFLLLTRDPDSDAVARRVIAAVEAAGSRASAGVASFPRDGRDAASLFAAADVALRLSKRGGKGRVTRYEGPSIATRQPEELRRALERLCGGEGIAIELQPVFELEGGTVHAYEALTRFVARESSDPLYWLTLADELELRAELELACLRAALAFAPRLPPRTLLTVNLSAELLADPAVRQACQATGRPERLVIEVAEQELDQPRAAMRREIAGLSAIGVRFAVDDVDADHSGLGHLAVVGPSYLKLDHGLIRELDTDPARASLLNGLIRVSSESGCRVIATGVETSAELDAARSAGIELGQGFLLVRPRAGFSTPQGVAADGPPVQATDGLPEPAPLAQPT